ncbi:hypothetical protein Pmani_022727 [Petrolisthes manimaculis]|uniref:Uncharacterized protein n=1 Tax=Petrolisthes manimaculis TaxID=1843537 RepID=A0AAE1PB80_9EUCA|nr:hypothetical protein Pmani_022727 [Petrolisthes manimaculis]
MYHLLGTPALEKDEMEVLKEGRLRSNTNYTPPPSQTILVARVYYSPVIYQPVYVPATQHRQREQHFNYDRNYIWQTNNTATHHGSTSPYYNTH